MFNAIIFFLFFPFFYQFWVGGKIFETFLSREWGEVVLIPVPLNNFCKDHKYCPAGRNILMAVRKLV